ncbi:MAG: hypothetical protein CME70_06270 [Halobacteriovorax sp.]|nr:hypothetical protein [Halobacteriovorax sp.]|tara:strand:+ start:10333 stop:13404 length:3072 start_codon:yes stop_codon:yes gene_type:complete
MAIFELTKDHFENLSLTTHPRREFVSASVESSQPSGMTGTVHVFAQRSPIEKEAQKLRAFSDAASIFEDENLESIRSELVISASDLGVTDIFGSINNYMGSLDPNTGIPTTPVSINSSGPSERKKKVVEVLRFEPSVRFTSDTSRKNVTRQILFPYYRSMYPSLHWATTNYHSLNFFTASNVPSDSVLIYPAAAITTEVPKVIPYSPPEGFTFDFYINPRYYIRDEEPNTAAVATITIFDDGGGQAVAADLDTDVPAEDGFTITDSNGTSIVYYFDKDVHWSATGNVTASGVLIGIGTLGAFPPCTDVAEQVEIAINSVNGHGNMGTNTITVNRIGNVIHLTQNILGPAGNVTIDPGDTNLGLPSEAILYSGFDFGGPIYPEFKAGTIFHMSSSYTVSLVSGSSTSNYDEELDGFRIMLQLSSSAEVPPSTIPLYDGSGNIIENNEHLITAGYGGVEPYDPMTGEGTPTDLIFASSDNSLKRDHWHHVAIRWGTDAVNNGTGSFVIDGKVDSEFVIQSGSVIPQEFDNHITHLDEELGDPSAVFIGNFYEGRNNLDVTAMPNQHYIGGFFDSATSVSEGLIYGDNVGSGLDALEHGTYAFNHPLNAEVHDLKVWDHYRSLEQVVTSSMYGISSINQGDGLLFYVPPFFVKETRERDVLLTPFQNMTTTTDDPFNVAMSFGVGGHLLNLENFCREFVRKDYPRLLNLTASRIDVQVQTPLEANEYLFATSSIRKRNLTVLPCDNGLFFPGFRLLSSGSITTHPVSGSETEKYTNDFGSLDYSKISLTNLIPEETLYPGLIQVDSLGEGTPEEASGTMAAIMGASPENPGIAPGSVLTIFQRTRDGSSNEVVFFDASNLFYGNAIQPNTYEIYDSDVTGSDGKVRIRMRDNGIGGLYRADAKTPHAKWADAGSIIYEEGISVIKSPVIPYYGKEQFEVKMAGDQNIHIMEIHVPCDAGTINSSSNPQFEKLYASNFASENESEFVYITGLNFHDENLNVVARTNLARPIIKRNSDGYVFRVKVDF